MGFLGEHELHLDGRRIVALVGNVDVESNEPALDGLALRADRHVPGRRHGRHHRDCEREYCECELPRHVVQPFGEPS